MIWFIILIVVGIIIYSATKDSSQDDVELDVEQLHEKHLLIVEAINNAAYQGKGKVVYSDKKCFQLLKFDNNQNIEFTYFGGVLTIRWSLTQYNEDLKFRLSLDTRKLTDTQQFEKVSSLINEVFDEVYLLKHKSESRH
ncbi:MAG: hypothetical protein ABJF04_09350 [Reichenbachiella sp.]|uniref:hypothetical protein n=1 Tax=Reichenbachiella sp. TaxID=2184521 RepID=UPI0032647C89